jgi:O-antigen/teichoic acid export membrane protein
VFPVLARLQGGSQGEFNRMLGKNFLFLFAAGIVIAAGTYLMAGPIISILFGEQYADSAGMLRILAPMILFSFMHYLTSGALVAMGREILTTLTLCLGAAISVTLGFMFIPASGAHAAGLIKVAAEGVTFVIEGALLAGFILKAHAGAAHQPSGLR